MATSLSQPCAITMPANQDDDIMNETIALDGFMFSFLN